MNLRMKLQYSLMMYFKTQLAHTRAWPLVPALCIIAVISAGCAENKKKNTEQMKRLAKIPVTTRQGLPEASGGYILKVGSETISSEEIIRPAAINLKDLTQQTTLEQFKIQFRPHLEKELSDRISNILLYEMASRAAGEDIEDALETAVNSEIRQFIAGFGGNTAKAEQALKQMGMDWESFRDYQKKMILTQSYLQKQMPVDKPITYSEILDLYNSIKDSEYSRDATIQFQLIDINITMVDANDFTEAKAKASSMADEAMNRLANNEDFNNIVAEFSHGHRKVYGGLWKPVKLDSLAKPYDELIKTAQTMRIGDVAGPIETSQHIFIMKLLDKQSSNVVPLEDVQHEIEARINMTRRKEAIEQLSNKVTQQANISNKEQFIEYCLERIYYESSRGG